MIPILPDQVLKNRPADAALKRVFRLIRQLPLPGARAWLAFDPQSRPDFLLNDGNDRCFLISAIGLKPAEAHEILDPGLFELPEATLRRRDRIGAVIGILAREVPGAAPRILILPGLEQRLVELLRERFDPGGVARWVGDPLARDPERFVAELERIGGDPPDPLAASALRAEFSPECEVPSAFVPKLSAADYRQTNRAARFSGNLLDFDQETPWVKHDLVLDDAGARAAEGNARLITGAAGSGKSLALLYRARLLAGLGQHHNLLFVTHNKPLIADLEWRFEHLAHLLPVAGRARVVFRHFFRWLGQLDTRSGDDGLKLVYDQERISLIRGLAADLFRGSDWAESFLVDEVALIADQVDDSEEAYLELDRSGRGIRLGEGQRRRIHQLYRRYRAALVSERQKDWYSIVRETWDRISNDELALPRYDLIFVDEGQFFAPVWFAILKRCLAPGGEMIVSADPTQGFLKRRQSWRSVGLEVRGRSTRLERSYRSTPALQAFARRFYQSRNPDEEEEITLPDGGGDSGSTPRLVQHPTPQDAVAWAAAEVGAGIAGGLRPEAFLVIHEDSRQREALRRTIPGSTVLDYNVAARDRVAITSLNAATGIERPIVILLGLDRLFEKEGDPRLAPEERAELIRDHTRKIYMAITRAGEKLLISYGSDEIRRVLCGGA